MQKCQFAVVPIALGALFLLSGRIGQAQAIVYDNGGPNQQSGNEMTEWIQAEDFTLGSPATLTDVHFWDGELSNAYQGSIVWTIYNDNSGQPGSMVARGTANPTHTDTGVALGNFGNGYEEFKDDFDIPGVNLAAGTYWLGLHNGPLTTDSRDEFYWETTDPNGTTIGNEDITPFDDGNWFNNGQEHAFYLTASTTGAVPEPGLLSLLSGMSLSGSAWALRRRRK